MSDATNDARGIAVAGDKLVWATGCANRLRVVGKDGTNNLALPQGTHCTPSIAVGPDLTLTYWTEYNGPYLYATPVDGTGALRIVATLSKAAQNNFGRVVVDATTAYFAITSPPGVYFATAGGLGQAPHVVAGEASGESAGSPFGIAVSRTHLYWSDTAGGVIKRRALDGLGESRAGEIVASEAGPRDITLDAERIYWLTAGGDVRAKALDGSGTVSVLQSGQTAAESIVVDDTYVYFTRYASGAPVSRVPKIGGKVEVLAGQQRFPYGLAQDCTTIYWTEQANFGTGAIRKVTK